MPMPTPYDSWSGGYDIVNGRDARSDTTYMFGGVLAGTGIRISSEFDSSDSNTAGIQEAIDDLPAAGGTVLIPPGTHEISFLILVDKSNVHLVGVGDSSIVKIADGRTSTLSAQALAAQADLVVADGTQFRAGDYICIKDVGGAANSVECRIIDSISGNTLTVTVDLAFTHPIATEVWTSHPTLLTESAVTGLRISDLNIDGNRDGQMEGDLGEIFAAIAANASNLPLPASVEAWGTIILWDTSDVRIENIKMDNMPAHGIFIWGASQNTTDVTIRNCSLTDVADKGIVALQLVAATPVYVKIENNIIIECGVGVRHLPSAAINYGDGIQFHTPTGTNITIRGNIIDGWRRSGIAMDGTVNTVISDNVILGIVNTLIGNAGILFQNSEYCVLSNNVVYLDRSFKNSALSLWDCSDISVVGGTLAIPDRGVNATNVLIVADVGGTRPTDITIMGVVIEANTGTITDPRTIYPLSLIECDRITVSDCIIKSPGVGRPGVRLEDAQDCTIHDNLILDDKTARQMTFGIALDAASERNHIHHNRIEGYITGAIDDNGAFNIFEENLRNYLTNTNIENVTVQADAAQADVVVTDGSVFFVGQGVIISDGSPQEEHANIGSIAGTVLTMDENLVNTYLLVNNPVLTGKDTAGIQEAINNLPAIGGVVNIPAGNNTISSSIIVNKPCLIRGEGDASVVVLANNSNVDMFVLPANQTDVIMRDFVIDGNYANNATAGHGIFCMDGNHDCVLENLLIRECRDMGIFFLNVATRTLRIRIEGCHIDDCHPDVVFGNAGIYLDHVDDSQIVNNVVVNCGDTGITIDFAVHTLISGNVSNRNTRFGIYFVGTLENVIASNNMVEANDSIGIYVAGNIIRDLLIVDNTCQLNDDGILLYRTDGAIVRGNLCRNARNTFSGIHVSGTGGNTSSDHMIVDNVCTNAVDQERGIWIEGGANAARCIVRGNVCRGNDTENIQDDGVDTIMDHNVTR